MLNLSKHTLQAVTQCNNDLRNDPKWVAVVQDLQAKGKLPMYRIRVAEMAIGTRYYPQFYELVDGWAELCYEQHGFDSNESAAQRIQEDIEDRLNSVAFKETFIPYF